MVSRAEADEILNTRRKRKACYPCSSRKVKCNGLRPCASCMQRGHPEICIIDNSRPGRRSAASIHSPRSHSVTHGTPSITSSADRIGSPPSQDVGHSPSDSNVHAYASRDPLVLPLDAASSADGESHLNVVSNGESNDHTEQSYVGANCTPAIVHASPYDIASGLGNEVRPALGLQNTLRAYPYMEDISSTDHAKVLNELIPSHADVLKYSEIYQNIVYPFQSLHLDSGDLEELVCFYLELTSARETPSTSKSKSGERRINVAQTSLLLAVLASGVQFSELPPCKRMSLSREFARRSFHCARLANFLLRPTVFTLQALSLLGVVLQNDGQADAAWALMGTTVRLAQSLGLHIPDTVDASVQDKNEKGRLWSGILCQDSLLSLNFDRYPAGWNMDTDAPSLQLGRTIGFADCMSRLGDFVREYLRTAHQNRTNAELALQYLAKLGLVEGLRDENLQRPTERATRRARMEWQALKLHIAFSRSVVCRAFLRRDKSLEEHRELALTARHSFVEAMQAFLDLRSLTLVPLRTWSMVHGALSSALLLEIFGPPDQSSPEHSTEDAVTHARDVQTDLINALSRERYPIEAAPELDGQLWLSTPHMKALNSLKLLNHRRWPRESPHATRQDDPPRFPRETSSRPLNGQRETIQTDIPLVMASEPPYTDSAGVNMPQTDPNMYAGPDISDLPLNDLGNIDWGNVFFNVDSNVDNWDSQYQWDFEY